MAQKATKSVITFKKGSPNEFKYQVVEGGVREINAKNLPDVDAIYTIAKFKWRYRQYKLFEEI